MKVLLVRRAYSPSGGAEKYLLRLAAGLRGKGVRVGLATAAEWPGEAWGSGEVVRIPGSGPAAFADAFREIRASLGADVVFSLERVWEADFYRAGDGVHRAWLRRLSRRSSPLANFFRARKRKHREILSLERSLYAPPSRTRVIANSELVAREIREFYGAEEERITVIPNGYDARPSGSKDSLETRRRKRESLGVAEGETLLLFAGSGWKRKGALPCVQAMKRLERSGVRLALAGKAERGIPWRPSVSFLGEVAEMRELYAAADIFRPPHALRSVFQRLPGGGRARASRGDHEGERLQRGLADARRGNDPGRSLRPCRDCRCGGELA